jgi:hypothetical protein
MMIPNMVCNRGAVMNRKNMLLIGMTMVWLAVLGLAMSAQDKYTVNQGSNPPRQ